MFYEIFFWVFVGFLNGLIVSFFVYGLFIRHLILSKKIKLMDEDGNWISGENYFEKFNS